MLRGRKGWLVAASIAVAGVASAQAPATQDTPAASQAPEPEPKLSPDQQLKSAQDNYAGMQRIMAEVGQQLTQAKDAKDVVKVLCLNDKSNQLDVALHSAKDRLDALQAAVERKDTERANHEYVVSGVLNDRVHALAAEASQCIGEETNFGGDTIVSVDINGVPDTDPSFSPSDPFGGVQASGAFGPDDITPPPEPVSAIE